MAQSTPLSEYVGNGNLWLHLFQMNMRGDKTPMTQTLDGQKDTPQPQKQYRPGQRQQERLMRLARRRRQRMIIGASLLGVVLIALAGVGIWQYPRIIALYPHPAKAVGKPTNYACSVDAASSSLYTPVPAAGPAAPPTIKTAAGTLSSDGLQCIDLKVGSGTTAQVGSALSVQYTGWLKQDGQKFDSSFDRHAQPISVLLGQNQIIKGWEEGLIGIQAGGIRRLIIPGALAYGNQGQAQSNPPIPPNATLIFDIIVQSIHACPVATANNVYNSTPTPNPATPVIGPVVASTPAAGPLAPPPVTTPPGMLLDGLTCIDLNVGSGPAAQSGSALTVQYTGWIAANGKKFDSSYDHGGQPFSVTLGQGKIIKGFEEGLIGIKAGGTRRLIIPGALAYGAQGRPPTIPPNATLIFDVTVVSVK